MYKTRKTNSSEMYFIMACLKAFVRKYLNDKKTWFD